MTIKTQCGPEDHRWEYWCDKDAMTWYRCLACGETEFHPMEHHGC